MADESDLETLIDEATGLGNPAEARSVAAGLRQLDAWRSNNPGRVVAVKGVTYESPRGEFKVSFVPDFGYEMDGQKIAIHVWNTSSVELSPRMTHAALALVSSAYAIGERPNDVAVLALPEHRLFRLSDVADYSRLAAIVATNLDRLFGDVRDEIVGPAPPAHIPPSLPRAADR